MPSDFTLALLLNRGREAANPHRRDARLEDEVLALFDRLRDPLLRYVSTFGLSIPDGEEIIQEAFLSLFRHLRASKSAENLSGWLFRVAHNLALKRRYRSRMDLERGAAAGEADSVIDPAPNPEQRAADGQNRRRLWVIVEALPERDRRCLFLRAEGLRYREIAGILKISVSAVSLSLARSLARLARVSERCML